MIVVPPGSEGPSELLLSKRPCKKIPVGTDGLFTFSIDGSLPHYIYFQSTGKRFFTLCFPQTDELQVSITATMHDYTSIRDESNGFVTSSNNELNKWFWVFFFTNPFLNNELGRFSKERSEWMREKGSLNGFTQTLDNYYKKLMTLYETAEREKLKQYIILNLAHLQAAGYYIVNERLLQTVLEQVKPSDFLWAYNAKFVPDMYKALGGLTKNKEMLLSWVDSLTEYTPLKSQIPLFLFSVVDDSYRNKLPEFEKYYELLLSNFPESPSAKNAEKEFGTNRRLKPGVTLPVFSVISTDNTGKVITNKNMEGKIFLLDFWATWCGPCIKSLPGYEKIYAKYRSKGFEILSISLDKDMSYVNRFLSKREKFPWLSGFMSDGKIASEIFKVHSLPKLILVDADGKILSVFRSELEGDALERTLEKYLN